MLVGATETDPEAPLSSEAFRQTLNELGWKEGISIRIDTRWGAGDPDRIRAYAKELIGTAPDVAVADSTSATLALQRESRTTPVIFIQAGNPVGSGLVANLTRPSGNLTEFTNYVPSMGGKWLELLKEVAPRPPVQARSTYVAWRKHRNQCCVQVDVQQFNAHWVRGFQLFLLPSLTGPHASFCPSRHHRA